MGIILEEERDIEFPGNEVLSTRGTFNPLKGSSGEISDAIEPSVVFHPRSKGVHRGGDPWSLQTDPSFSLAFPAVFPTNSVHERPRIIFVNETFLPGLQVSWIKRKNVQELLTVGLTTYANDERFQAIHFHHSEDWTLQIKYVQPRDAGLYQCQVSTHPPTSIFLFLEVVEARAEIAGPSEKFVRPGSTLQLHCLVKKSTETPSYLFWYHNFRMINYDIDQGVNVSTDLAGRESWLEVPRASNRHSGNYTCEASNAQPARVLVHVFKGDNPAAMQHSIASSPSVMACSALLMMFTTLKLVLHSTVTN
ncbi:hypothetical protein K0M31_009472 [Melipona bicolor]|uniref:Ig-like domain-containing protein n=1 Tax=Melipona bicolor TaxID=60889 RepID=A0AA40FNS5_9HYME|nr:hypothetical protein K0M31_009472 [Melipona bicolor]